MLKQNFQSEPTIDRWSSNDQLPSYETNKVKICAMRAVEIVYLYVDIHKNLIYFRNNTLFCKILRYARF